MVAASPRHLTQRKLRPRAIRSAKGCSPVLRGTSWRRVTPNGAGLRHASAPRQRIHSIAGGAPMRPPTWRHSIFGSRILPSQGGAAAGKFLFITAHRQGGTQDSSGEADTGRQLCGDECRRGPCRRDNCYRNGDPYTGKRRRPTERATSSACRRSSGAVKARRKEIRTKNIAQLIVPIPHSPILLDISESRIPGISSAFN